MSEVCETFDCLPDEAERQDWRLIRAIMDYRSAKRGLELFRRGARGMDALSAMPQTCNLLLEMDRAQGGGWDSVDGLMSEMKAMPGKDGEEAV